MRDAGVNRASGTVTITVDSSNEAYPAPASIGSVDLYTDASLSSDDEECSLDPQLAVQLGIAATDRVQVRVTRGTGQSAIFTVMALRQAAADNRIGLNAGGFAKLDSVATSLTGCTATTRVTWAGFTAVEADPDEVGGDTEGLYIERVRDDGSSSVCLITAPHGGILEAKTADQADACATELGCSLWVAEGYSRTYTTGGFGTAAASAYARFHITSTQLSFRSYPLLGTLAQRGFTYAIAFHGISDVTAAALGGGATSVLVGGNAPEALREAIATEVEAIVGFTGAGYSARAATPDDSPFAGNDADNYINLITGTVTDGVFTSSDAGIQIEQSSSVRAAFWQEIAQAVATVIAAQ